MTTGLFRKPFTRSDQTFCQKSLDNFDRKTGTLIRAQQGLQNGFLSRNVLTLSAIRNRFNSSKKIPRHLHIINETSRIFHSTIIGPFSKHIRSHNPTSSKIQEKIKDLINVLSSKEEPSFGLLTSAQIDNIRKQISGDTKEDRFIQTISAVTHAILIESNLSSQDKLSALKYFIELQTDSHLELFCLENLDTLINHIQSKDPIEEFLPLLNGYSITANMVQKIRESVNNSSTLPIERGVLFIYYLSQGIASSKIPYGQEILHALRSKHQNLLLGYFETHLTYLLDLMISDKPVRTNFLDNHFLSSEQIQEIREMIQNQRIGEDLSKKLTAIDYLITITKDICSLPLVKEEVLNLLHAKEKQLQEIYQLNQLICLTLSESSIEESFLAQYQLTNQQIEEIRKGSKELSSRSRQMYILKSLRDEIAKSSIETELKERLIKRLDIKIAILNAQPLNYQEELRSLIDVTIKEGLSSEDEELSRKLARKYGFHPENILSLRQLLGVTNRPPELDQSTLDCLISVIESRDHRITEESKKLLSKYGISPEKVESIQYILMVRSHFLEVDPSIRFSEYTHLNYSQDFIRSIERNLSETPAMIIERHLKESNSLKRLFAITKYPFELEPPALEYLVSVIMNNGVITGELKTLLSRYGISPEGIEFIRNNLITTSSFACMDYRTRLSQYYRLGYNPDAIQPIEYNLSKDPKTIIEEHLKEIVLRKTEQNRQYLRASLKSFIKDGTLPDPDKTRALHVLRANFR